MRMFFLAWVLGLALFLVAGTAPPFSRGMVLVAVSVPLFLGLLAGSARLPTAFHAAITDLFLAVVAGFCLLYWGMLLLAFLLDGRWSLTGKLADVAGMHMAGAAFPIGLWFRRRKARKRAGNPNEQKEQSPSASSDHKSL